MRVELILQYSEYHASDTGWRAGRGGVIDPYNDSLMSVEIMRAY